MSVDRCACGASLGRESQLGLPGTATQTQCITCVTNDQIRHMLALLPGALERAFDELNAFEQGFLPSVRDQFARKGTLSPKQYETLERIYNRHA